MSSPDRYAPIGGAANDDNPKRTVTLLRRYRDIDEIVKSPFQLTATQPLVVLLLDEVWQSNLLKKWLLGWNSNLQPTPSGVELLIVQNLH